MMVQAVLAVDLADPDGAGDKFSWGPLLWFALTWSVEPLPEPSAPLVDAEIGPVCRRPFWLWPLLSLSFSRPSPVDTVGLAAGLTPWA